mgnify:CR=1 FL=1
MRDLKYRVFFENLLEEVKNELVDKALSDGKLYALGLKEQLIFPEIEYDKIDKIRGMDICFVTTANTDEEARALLAALGAPFAKN